LIAKRVGAVEGNYSRLEAAPIGVGKQLEQHDLRSTEGEIIDDVQDSYRFHRFTVPVSIRAKLSCMISDHRDFSTNNCEPGSEAVLTKIYFVRGLSNALYAAIITFSSRHRLSGWTSKRLDLSFAPAVMQTLSARRCQFAVII
jgi:hypothetical protein